MDKTVEIKIVGEGATDSKKLGVNVCFNNSDSPFDFSIVGNATAVESQQR